MPLQVPSLTFSNAEKIGDYLSKDQVTRLIDDLQRAHTAELAAALKPVRDEATALEAKLKDAQKLAEKAGSLEKELGEVRSTHERHTTLSELLGVTDPQDIADIAAIHASRTAGAEKPVPIRDWVTANLAKPEEAPAMLRGYLDKAPKQTTTQTQQRTTTTQQTQTQVRTGQGRVQTGGPSNQRVTAQDIMKLRPGSPEWKQARAMWREQQGLAQLPPEKSDQTT